MSSERKEATRWAVWALVALVIFVITLTVVGFGLRSAGLLGSTIVEREVFEQSYQRQAGLEARLEGLYAQKAEIEVQLRNPDLSEAVRTDLEATEAMLRVQIQSTERQLEQ